MERGSEEEGKRKKEDGWRGMSGKKERENQMTGGSERGGRRAEARLGERRKGALGEPSVPPPSLAPSHAS